MRTLSWLGGLVLFATSTQARTVRYAVTDVFMVEADSMEGALEMCQMNPNAVSVGVDWGNENNRAVVQLCQRRQRVEEIHSSRHVLQQIAVYDTPACPTSMELLYQVSEGRVVCVRRVAASVALSSGNYISDLWVSAERHYNNDAVGWTTIPESVLSPANGILRSIWQWVWRASYRGAFISYQRPVVPVTAVRLLTGVDASIFRTACFTWLGDQWEDAGLGYLDGSHGKKSQLCVRRGENADNLALLEATTTTDGCPSRFSQTEKLENGIKLCFRWGESTASDSPIMGIRLEPSSGKPKATLPGGFQLVSPTNLNRGSEAVYLYTTQATSTTVPLPAPLNRPPLVAKHITGVDGKPEKLTFKILQLADLHYSGDPTTSCNDKPIGMAECSEALMTQFVNDLLDSEKPDFVAFSGDNVQTYKASLRQAAMDAATSGVEARGIPYAMIFGNHDDQRGFTREMLMEMAVNKQHSYSQRGPTQVYGVGNYELNVKAPTSGTWGDVDSDVFRMYFLDSNAYPDRGLLPNEDTKYDWVHPSQVAYYRQLSASHETKVPSIMFFHIPLPEYAMDARSLRAGEHREYVQSSEVHSDLFSTLVELDEVKATFAGHDHVNEYCYKRESVQLCYGGGTGFGVAYGWKEVQRRARVIEWTVDSTNKREIRSWKVLYGQIQQRVDEQVLYRV
ncbi:hypothetical protein Poli38472_011777 [Pythium oligandrum]|uniref:Calcineurin-like phosphoesterase domain-containing protein n=1 Tax=Pythium oligandrum TaxID=41045 RepID=A0A8K1C837_PYTOL|nr:hypothetical protein Poli38472_011777 [Pythium oligandrum]|eukprot:TMW58189.1 hypothetical protein Poli38472_011777 [Pythium oligandrum]